MSLEINVATMRWYRAYMKRRVAGTAKRKASIAAAGLNLYTREAYNLTEAESMLDAARKEEQRMKRALLKACAKVPAFKDEPLCIDV